MNNPFSYIRLRVCPAEGPAFIGRSRQLEEVVNNITSEKPQHISIYGLPHIGKTSFLIKLNKVLAEKENCLPVRVPAFAEGDFNNNLIYMLDAMADNAPQLDSILDSLEAEDNSTLLAALKECISVLTAQNIRTVLLLDEFERILGTEPDDPDTVLSGWNQEEYKLFLELLMDSSLNLVCVTASRPKMSNILYRYRPSINPFVSMLLGGFDDYEMSQYFDVLDKGGARLNGLSIKDAANSAHYDDLLRICGRNPYLLTIMGNELFENTAKEDDKAACSVQTLFNGCSAVFTDYFNSIIQFMATEEQKKMRSFSHVVKCYFGLFEDYQDIKERCIALGYLDLATKKSPYTYKEKIFPFTDTDDKFRIYDQSGQALTAAEKQRAGLVYTTVSPLFTDYLFSVRKPIGKRKIIPLDLIEDQRDLLTGLIHTMRDITAKEFSKAYGSGWNDQLVRNYFSVKHIGSSDEEGLIYIDTAQLQRNKRYTAWKKYGSDVTRTVPKPPRQPNSPSSREYAAYQEYLNDKQNILNLWPTLVPGLPILISSPSLGFVCEEMIENSSAMASIDPINLVDQAQIFASFWNATSGPSFWKYFSILPNGYPQLEKMLSTLKDARNRISHFSRSEVSPQRAERDKIYCRQLLKGMYHFLFSGLPCPAGDLSETPGV